MGKRRRDLVDVIEAAYNVERSEAAWLDGVVRAAAPLLDHGLGVFGVTVDVTADGRLSPVKSASRGLSDETLTLVEMSIKGTPSSVVEAYLSVPVQSASEVLRGRLPMAQDYNRKLGSVSKSIDGFGIVARSPSGRIAILSIPLPRLTKPRSAFRTRWSRVAAHIAAGLRLQQRLAGAASSARVEVGDTSVDAADAILEPNGKLAHALGDAKSKSAREALRDAARSIDRARSTSRRQNEPDDAVAEWQALVSGRWSLVDHFDRDGRRFLIARPNEPGAHAHDALTMREREVVSYAALGHANKLIAYELGLPESTVSTELRRAAKRLGARSRLELVRMFAAAAAAAATAVATR